MIPKIIHYCWYGAPIVNNTMAYRCRNSWSHLGGGKLIEWNEDNCPCNENDFIRSAKTKKQYAFMSDYYRLKALYDYGGIYLDTDIEIRKPIPDSFYQYKCVFGFMYDNMVSSAFIMAEPHSPVIKGLLDYYEEGKVESEIANNKLYTEYLKKRYKHFLLIGKTQELEDGVVIFPKEYFECPTHHKDMGFAVHHFMGSWHHKKHLKLLRKIVKTLRFNIPLFDYVYQNIFRARGYKINAFYAQSVKDWEAYNKRNQQ